MAIKQPLVLLVDDEEDLCLLMQMTLARMGIKTHLALSCREQAKKFFTGFNYDACLTDLNLPDGNGLDLVKHVTQLSKYTDCCTNSVWQYGYRNRCLKAGAFDFVSKPVNQTHLDQLIQKH